MTRDPLEKALLVGLCACGMLALVFVIGRFSPEPAWADASGYFNSADLLARGRLTETLRLPSVLNDPYPYDFEPLGFHYDTAGAHLVPTYFIGFPLLLALGHTLVGWHYSPYLVEIGFGLLALACCYCLQREIGVCRLIALAVTANLAWCPVFVFGTSQPFSDTLATALCALAALGTLKGSKGRGGWYRIAGAALGLGLLVRSTNALLFPTLFLLATDAKGRRAVMLGCAPFVAALAVYQHLIYGNAARSGYGDIFRIFSWGYAPASLAAYVRTLPLLLPIALFAVAGALPAATLVSRRLRGALLLWIAAFALFYLFYFWTGQNWTYLRFVEPMFPALLVLAGAGLELLCARLAGPVVDPVRRRTLAAGGALAVAVLVALLSHYPNPKVHDRGFREAMAWMRSNLPPQALVVCESFSGTVYYATPNAVLRWDISATRNNRKYLQEMTGGGLPVYAVLDAAEAADPELRRKVPGRWEKIANLSTASAWRIYPP